MGEIRIIPEDPLAFIRGCVQGGRLLWTWHVDMRMKKRSMSREILLQTVAEYEIIESYPYDKYFPSYLVYTRRGEEVFHILFATDVEGSNVRIVTAYPPDPKEWSADLKRRIQA